MVDLWGIVSFRPEHSSVDLAEPQCSVAVQSRGTVSTLIL